MSDLRWRVYFLDVVGETDPAKLANKLSDAKMAIVERYRELLKSADSEEERQSLGEATRLLRKIEVERLAFPEVEDEQGKPIG